MMTRGSKRRLPALLILSALAIAAAPGLPLPLALAEAARAVPLQSLRTKWIVDGPTARALIDGGAVVLDSRDRTQRWWTPLPGAASISWQDFTNDDPATRGRLLANDTALTKTLQELGISTDTAVVVVGDVTKGWGEDGRIAWMLRSLGHPAAVIVDGGVGALTKGGAPAIRAPRRPGTFEVIRMPDLEVTKEALRGLVGAPGVVILDTREEREFGGGTPYGEVRGGHIPGARHLYFKDLVDPEGRVLAGDALAARLGDLGVTKSTKVIAYCTGGIRSAYVTAVLRDAGIDARNYAGSMWEWAASPEAEYPLETSGP